MAETSSLNCLSCGIPYQNLHSLNALKALLFTDVYFVASPSPSSAPIQAVLDGVPPMGLQVLFGESPKGQHD